MSTLETYRDKFAESGWRIFERAIAEARRREQNRAGVEHVIYALAQEKAELFNSLLGSLADSPKAFERLLELVEQRLDGAPKHEGAGIRLGAEAIALFKSTLKVVRSNGRRRIEATDLFISLVMDEDSLLRELLRKLLADSSIEPKDVRDLMAVVESAKASRPYFAQQTYKFLAGEAVRVRSGPFASFTGTISEVNEEALTLKITVFIMAREQPVELRFFDVEKLQSE
ncbi:MAG TPA: KOW motif-containing protein [Pyrinomonadaceae bacterium]|nr:KOW motif-containing protein [Pyrinomonadaceae bacterium]